MTQLISQWLFGPGKCWQMVFNIFQHDSRSCITHGLSSPLGSHVVFGSNRSRKHSWRGRPKRNVGDLDALWRCWKTEDLARPELDRQHDSSFGVMKRGKECKKRQSMTELMTVIPNFESLMWRVEGAKPKSHWKKDK